MPFLHKLIAIAYWLALTFWIGAIMTVAIAAMNTFGTLPGLGVSLDGYPDFPVEHHGRLAAGIIMERNFFMADVIQMFAIPIVLVTLLAQLLFCKMPLKRPANSIRFISLSTAAVVFGIYAFTIAPDMNRELRAYWTAAEAGQVEQAELHRAAFEVDHPRAEWFLEMNLIFALIGVGASAAAFVHSPSAAKTSVLEPPKLLNTP